MSVSEKSANEIFFILGFLRFGRSSLDYKQFRQGGVAPAMAMQNLKIFYTVDLVIDKGWSGSSPALKSEVQCGPTISSPQNFRPKVREKQCTEVHFSRNTKYRYHWYRKGVCALKE